MMIHVRGGGSRQRILMAIFRRPLIQMGLGVLAGISIIVAAIVMNPYSEGPGADEAGGSPPPQS